jgi:hypothetical protein
MLLSLVPAAAQCFTCLDLKGVFFCICLAPQSQPIFAFQWEKSQHWGKGELTWNQLPQTFKNSPTIFGTALASDLKAFSADQHGCTLLQYIDDLLLANQLRKTAWKGHAFSFLFLWDAGYKVSRKKGLDLPKHCQIPQLSLVLVATQAQP